VKLQPLDIAGSALVMSESHTDERGTFIRAFDADVFASAGLDNNIAHVNLSSSARRGTLRGMHYQTGQHAEAKVIRVLSGAVFDVLVDVRKDSPSYRSWVGVELRAGDGTAVAAPAGVAHGFLSLTDDTEMLYLMSRPYEPDRSAGVRWDDPVFSVEWPFKPIVISERDRAFADFVP
jgi:dTDP-4-dehydrorhamnose 3,5-epimerase